MSMITEQIEELRNLADAMEKSGQGISAKYVRNAADTIEDLSVKLEVKHGEWIPCSERLPEEPYGCLVTIMDTDPMTMEDFENLLPYFIGFDGERWHDGDGEEIPFEVIAWMPLPEPYKEE